MFSLFSSSDISSSSVGLMCLGILSEKKTLVMKNELVQRKGKREKKENSIQFSINMVKPTKNGHSAAVVRASP